MNEKIKEIAEQAGFMLWADEPWNDGDIIDWSACYDKELEKFVELIVKECVDISYTNGDNVDYLKKHFGVK